MEGKGPRPLAYLAKAPHFHSSLRMLLFLVMLRKYVQIGPKQGQAYSTMWEGMKPEVIVKDSLKFFLKVYFASSFNKVYLAIATS